MQVKWIGWCKDPKDNHDKVWGCALHKANPQGNRWLPSTYAIFWGRRGKKLQKQLKDLTENELDKMIRSKRDKGYIAVAPDKINEVYESFSKDLFKVALTVK